MNEDEVVIAAVGDIRFHERRVVAEEPVLRICGMEPIYIAREDGRARVVARRDDGGYVRIALYFLRVVVFDALHELVQGVFRRAGRLIAVAADADGHQQEDQDCHESLPALHNKNLLKIKQKIDRIPRLYGAILAGFSDYCLESSGIV